MSEIKKSSKSILNAILYREGRELIACPFEGKLLIGRRDKSEPPAPCLIEIDDACKKIVAADSDRPKFPRKLVELYRISNAQVKVSNIHSTETFSVTGGGIIDCNQSKMVGTPLTLLLPYGFTLAVVETEVKSSVPNKPESDVVSQRSKLRLPSENLEPIHYNTLLSNLRIGEKLSEHSLLSVPFNQNPDSVPIEASAFLEILDFVVLTAQKPATSEDFYKGIVEAVTRLIEVDRAEVIFWNENVWERSLDRTFCHALTANASQSAPSNTMLEKALTSREMVVFPDSELDVNPVSLREIVTAVACPILDEKGTVLGVLYADRISKPGSGKERVTRIEETLIEILATAIATGIAKVKRESLVTTYQQFFSSKVIDAIRSNPSVLAGEDCDVTVLFCDIRGFSRITERIGPANAMAWIQDTLTSLSEQVQVLDGVLVDYVGDELFAMWGAPDKVADHATRAATAAKQMMDLSVEMSKQWKDTIPEGFEFGIGLCTGTAHVGNTGSKQKFKYGPMGKTVNLGSRIQGLTKLWRVQTLMNEEAALRLPSGTPMRRICQARVIGMDECVTLYELCAERDRAHEVLRRSYENALRSYEEGDHREAAQAFSDLAKRFPNDGPSLMMLVRAVQEMANPQDNFNPIWIAPSK